MENLIVKRILEKLKAENKIDAEWINDEKYIKTLLDGELHISFQDKELIFPAEVKKEFKRHHLIQYETFKKTHSNFMVIADTINPEMRKELKEKGINYIDGACNMFINENKTYIYIEGNRQIQKTDLYKGRLFGKAGLKIIFALLVKEELLNAPYRDIAEFTDTGLGTVNYVIDQLKINEYIIRINKDTLRLKNKNKLTERWVTGYEEKLKETLLIGRYKLRQNDWKNLQFKKNITLWGGEPAAEILTQYLIPDKYIIYTDENIKDLIMNYYLTPDPNGNVTIYKKFWNFELNNNKEKTLEKTVPPLLVYSDLLNTNEPRNLETAKIIYGKYLQDKLD